MSRDDVLIFLRRWLLVYVAVASHLSSASEPVPSLENPPPVMAAPPPALAPFEILRSITDPQVAVSANPAVQTPPNRWRAESARDIMTGSTIAAITLDPLSFSGSGSRFPLVTISCRADTGALNVLFRLNAQISASSPSSGNHSTEINLRWGRRAPISEQWSLGTDRTFAFSRNARYTFEMMRRNENFALEASTIPGTSTIAAEFDSSGLNEVSDHISRCLPPLLPAEITRDFQVEVDRFSGLPIDRWRAFADQLSASGSVGPLLVSYGPVETLNGNQSSLRFSCRTGSLVARLRFQNVIRPPFFQIRLSAVIDGRYRSENITNIQITDERSFELRDSQRIFRQLISSGYIMITLIEKFSNIQTIGFFSTGLSELRGNQFLPCLRSLQSTTTVPARRP